MPESFFKSIKRACWKAAGVAGRLGHLHFSKLLFQLALRSLCARSLRVAS